MLFRLSLEAVLGDSEVIYIKFGGDTTFLKGLREAFDTKRGDQLLALH